MSTTEPKRTVRRQKKGIVGRLASVGMLHVLLMLLVMTMLVPFLWMLLTSVKPLAEVGAPDWLPTDWLWSNYADVFDTSPPKSYDGQVRSVDRDAGQMTLQTDGQQVQVPLTSEIEMWHGGQMIPTGRVGEGMDVTVNLPPGKGIPFGRFYWNSIFIAAWVTFLQVFTSSLAAFAFSRVQWPGRDKVFLLYLATMMLPGLVMMIPNYQIMITLGLVDTYAGLILPAAFSAFGTFLLRQFMMSIPTELDEAAEIDGASKWGVYWNVILPLARPGLITLTIFTFMGNYRSLFWPLVMLKSLDKYTLPIGLLWFDSTAGQETNLLMAAATMMVIPLIILFVVMQKYLVKGIQLGAVKG